VSWKIADRPAAASASKSGVGRALTAAEIDLITGGGYTSGGAFAYATANATATGTSTSINVSTYTSTRVINLFGYDSFALAIGTVTASASGPEASVNASVNGFAITW